MTQQDIFDRPRPRKILGRDIVDFFHEQRLQQEPLSVVVKRALVEYPGISMQQDIDRIYFNATYRGSPCLITLREYHKIENGERVPRLDIKIEFPIHYTPRQDEP